MPPQHDTGKPKETADVVEGVVAEGYGTATEEEVPRFWLYLSCVSRNVTGRQRQRRQQNEIYLVQSWCACQPEAQSPRFCDVA